jgi:hypothetical protein
MNDTSTILPHRNRLLQFLDTVQKVSVSSKICLSHGRSRRAKIADKEPLHRRAILDNSSRQELLLNSITVNPISLSDQPGNDRCYTAELRQREGATNVLDNSNPG